jgi:uncharacterized surface protein with fasciclin (FAS1) repeats
MRTKFLQALLVFALLLMPMSAVFAQDDAETPGTIAAQVIEAASMEDAAEFTILLAAVQAAHPSILELLDNEEASLTVFAPTDAAFEALLEALDVTAEDLLANRALLNRVLLYHVMDGYALAEDIVMLETFPTLASGADVTVSTDDEGNVMLDGNSMVIVPDVLADNGVIHVIDSVLIPTERDVEPTTLLGQVIAASSDEDEPEFTILYQAIMNADPMIADLLANEDASLTVFAPTDEAFTALLTEFDLTAEELLADTATLDAVLEYHVMDGYALAEDIIMLETFPTLLEGAEVTVTAEDNGNVFLNGDVQIILTDVTVANGVIHVIDNVLLPVMEAEAE